MRIVFVLKGTLSVHVLNHVCSLVILRLAKVWRRSCRRYVRNTLRNKSVVLFTAILAYPSVSPFHIIIVSHIRFYAYDFCRADVELQRYSGVHLTNTRSEVTWACDVTTIEREGVSLC